MWPLVAAAGISAAGGIAGSIFGGKAQKKAAKKANKIAKQQLKYQKYYDANRVAITVADAKRAGIHPLAALGANISPSSVTPVGYMDPGDGGWGDAIANGLNSIGQGFSSLYQSDLDQMRYNDSVAENKDIRRVQEHQWRSEMYQRDRQISFQEKMQDLNARAIQAQIEETTSRTRLNQMRAAAIGGPPPGLQPKFLTDAFGNTIRRGPGTSSQDVADEYGDLMGEWFGIQNYLGDNFPRFYEWLGE